MHEQLKNFSPEFLENAKLSPFAMKSIECIQHGMTPYAVIESLVKVINDRDAEVLKSATLYPGGFMIMTGGAHGPKARPTGFKHLYMPVDDAASNLDNANNKVYNLPTDATVTIIVPKVFIVEAVRAHERVVLSAHSTQESADEQVRYYDEHFYKYPYDFCEVKEMEVAS